MHTTSVAARKLDTPGTVFHLRRRFHMWNEDLSSNPPELVISTGSQSDAAVCKLLADVGILPEERVTSGSLDLIIGAIDDTMAELMMAKRKKDVEPDDDLDDEEEEEEDDLEEEEDEDDFDDEEDEDDEFEEEFGDDDLDDDDDDIFYDDEDDE
jgi:hypothetical protein